MNENTNTSRRCGDVTASVTSAQTVVDNGQAVGEGVILFRPDGTVTAVNPAVEILTALRQEELVGKNLRNIMPRLLEGADLAMAMRAIEAVAHGRTSVLEPIVLRRDTDVPVTISPSISWVRASNRTPASAVLTLKDLTELHRTAELLNNIFDNMHMQIVCLDTHFNYVRVNRAYAEARGQSQAFFSGKNYFAMLPYPEYKAVFLKVLETGEPYAVFEEAFEHPERPEQGITYWDWSLRPIRRVKGDTEGLLLCLLDVTERVLARRKQAQSEKEYRELVEYANSIIMRLTPDHRITFFNEYAQSFFGYAAEEIVGRSVLETIVPPIDSEGRDLCKMTREITAHPEMYSSNDNENVCKDGRRVWIHWSNRAIRDELGAVREILCVGNEITQRRKLAKEAEKYRRRLQRLADRLTVTEEQGRRRVATQIHDTVVQTLSLSNIRLGSVMAALEKAGMHDDRAHVAGVRQMLDQGIKECRGLMEELVPSLLYEVGLPAALRDFAQKQSVSAGTRITVEGNGDAVPLDDELRVLLFHCARELVMNALKYAGRCEIRLVLSLADEYVQIQVRDTGRGFDSSLLDSVVSDHANGGFGFFNIRERVEGIGGVFTVESAPGQGTAATVRVPRGTDS